MPADSSSQAARAYEEEMLSFGAYDHFVMRNKAETVRNKRMAIRYENITRGLPDPTRWKPRLWRMYRAMKRRGGPLERRIPVGTPQLQWLKARCVNLRGQHSAHDLAALASIWLCWFYMLRIGECVVGNAAEDTIDALRYSQITFQVGEEEVQYIHPRGWFGAASGSEMTRPDTLFVRPLKTKTEQFGGECVRCHGATGGDLCVVAMCADYVESRGTDFRRGLAGDRAFLRFPEGHPVQRKHVERWVKLAARAAAMPVDRVNTHSLRMGGASATYAATRDLDTVRRWGRWRGRAADLYVFEAASNMRRDAQRMVDAGRGFLS